jgi:phosphoribosyl-dephospho-CoA transferase
MVLRAHDLVWIRTEAAFVPDDAPMWVSDILKRTRLAVVRRSAAPEGCVSIGIRGNLRHQRYSTFARSVDVTLHHTPESLAPELDSLEAEGIGYTLPAWRALRAVTLFFGKSRFVWGPVGSVGFHLATGLDVLTVESDLDVVLRFTVAPDRMQLEDFKRVIDGLEVRVDALLEGPAGAVSLEEFLQRPDRLLIKTETGPRLGAFVW